MYHTKKDGTTMLISAMSDDHLWNTMNCIKRKAKNGVRYGCYSSLTDQYCWEDIVTGEDALEILNYYDYKEEWDKRQVAYAHLDSFNPVPTHLHITSDGREIPITELAYDHLKSIIRRQLEISQEGFIVNGGGCGDGYWSKELYGEDALHALGYYRYLEELTRRNQEIRDRNLKQLQSEL